MCVERQSFPRNALDSHGLVPKPSHGSIESAVGVAVHVFHAIESGFHRRTAVAQHVHKAPSIRLAQRFIIRDVNNDALSGGRHASQPVKTLQGAIFADDDAIGHVAEIDEASNMGEGVVFEEGQPCDLGDAFQCGLLMYVSADDHGLGMEFT